MIKYSFLIMILFAIQFNYGDSLVVEDTVLNKNIAKEEATKIVEKIKRSGILNKMHPKLDKDSFGITSWDVRSQNQNRVSVRTKYGMFDVDRETNKITSIVFRGERKEVEKALGKKSVLYSESTARKLAKEIASSVIGDVSDFNIDYEYVERLGRKFYRYAFSPKPKGLFMDERTFKIDIDATNGNMMNAIANHTTLPLNLDYKPKVNNVEAKKIFDENTKDLANVIIKASGLVKKDIKDEKIWVWRFKYTFDYISGNLRSNRATSGYVDSETGAFYPGMIW